MTDDDYPQPGRFPVGHPEREREQQRKNALLTAIVDGVGPVHPPTSRVRARELEGFVARPDAFVPLREGWRRSELDRGGPYRAEQLPGWRGAWIVVDRLGGNCWTRDTGQVADSRQQVAEATAAAWNHDGGFAAITPHPEQPR